MAFFVYFMMPLPQDQKSDGFSAGPYVTAWKQHPFGISTLLLASAGEPGIRMGDSVAILDRKGFFWDHLKISCSSWLENILDFLNNLLINRSEKCPFRYFWSQNEACDVGIEQGYTNMNPLGLRQRCTVWKWCPSCIKSLFNWLLNVLIHWKIEAPFY